MIYVQCRHHWCRYLRLALRAGFRDAFDTTSITGHLRQRDFTDGGTMHLKLLGNVQLALALMRYLFPLRDAKGLEQSAQRMLRLNSSAARRCSEGQ